MIQRSKDYFGSDEELVFLSGDYESATDNLNPKLSQIVDNMMLDQLQMDFEVPIDSDLCLAMWKSMAKILMFMGIEGPSDVEKHWVLINTWFREGFRVSGREVTSISRKRDSMWSGRRIIDKNDVFTQTMGQLMGDIKSFPVLCMINLALWNLVNENKKVKIIREHEETIVSKKSYKVEYLNPPCLINGDDFLAYAPRRIVEKWFNLVSEFDLKASVGKTYVSKKVAQINSTNFVYNGGSVFKVKAIPVHAVMSIPKDRPVTQSINYAIEHDKEFCFNRLLFYNKPRINQVTGGGLINLCLPIELGGLGVEKKPKNITARQYAIAWNNRLKPENRRIL